VRVGLLIFPPPGIIRLEAAPAEPNVDSWHPPAPGAALTSRLQSRSPAETGAADTRNAVRYAIGREALVDEPFSERAVGENVGRDFGGPSPHGRQGSDPSGRRSGRLRFPIWYFVDDHIPEIAAVGAPAGEQTCGAGPVGDESLPDLGGRRPIDIVRSGDSLDELLDIIERLH
jgi:hypothetical protein